MVNRPQFQNGGYTVGGKKYKQLVGSRAQVWNGTALKTGYGRAGLKKSDFSASFSSFFQLMSSELSTGTVGELIILLIVILVMLLTI